jgi:predicted RNA-binding Zn-ribbon protein involved in translation (DUF1610 family)
MGASGCHPASARVVERRSPNQPALLAACQRAALGTGAPGDSARMRPAGAGSRALRFSQCRSQVYQWPVEGNGLAGEICSKQLQAMATRCETCQENLPEGISVAQLNCPRCGVRLAGSTEVSDSTAPQRGTVLLLTSFIVLSFVPFLSLLTMPIALLIGAAVGTRLGKSKAGKFGYGFAVATGSLLAAFSVANIGCYAILR